MVHCNTCKSDLYEEDHIDSVAPFGICDKCSGQVNTSNSPTLKVLTMENITDGAKDKYMAKKGDTIRITLTSSVLLSDPPTIKIQDETINSSEIQNIDNFTFIAEINTNDYNLHDGILNILAENLRSMWGVKGENVDKTTDNKYITCDITPPEYIYIAE